MCCLTTKTRCQKTILINRRATSQNMAQHCSPRFNVSPHFNLVSQPMGNPSQPDWLTHIFDFSLHNFFSTRWKSTLCHDNDGETSPLCRALFDSFIKFFEIE